MTILPLALRSLWNRKLVMSLVALAIAFSMSLLLGVERIAAGARDSFQNTVADTHLIVGARSGPLQLLLHSVFHIGTPTAAISWNSYEAFASHPEVAWTIPVSLGDSYLGFPVVGTNEDHFAHFRYADGKELAFAEGAPFEAHLEAVLGADVAIELGHKIGDAITLAHGVTRESFLQHDDSPFRIRGILRRTGTPVDRSVYIPLAGMEALHAGWENGVPPMTGMGAIESEPDDNSDDQQHHSHEEAGEPERITAFFVGLKSPVGLFQLQREIADYGDEPLTAILPTATLLEVWKTVDVANGAFRLIAIFVVLGGLISMVAILLATLEQRRREMSILRAVGARPLHVFGLLVTEAGLLTTAGCVLAIVLLYLGIATAGPWIEGRFGLVLDSGLLSGRELLILAIVVLCGMLVGVIPAFRAYWSSLSDGLTVRF